MSIPSYSDEEKQNICAFCFDTLVCVQEDLAQLPAFPVGVEDSEFPVFVTWLLEGKRRGCMGTFAASKLSENVLRFAYISGFKDPRYPPISSEEND